MQHRIWEKRARRRSRGSTAARRFYVCGDMNAMAKDVRATLVRAYADVKSLSPEAADRRSRRSNATSAISRMCIEWPTSPATSTSRRPRLPARHARRRPRRRDHRRDRRGRSAAGEIPRHVPAGRPRPARRARAQEAGEGLRLHAARAHLGRRAQHKAVARARLDRARLRQRHDARDHAPDHPAARRHQVEPEGDAEGDRRAAAQHHRGLRRREPQRDVQPEPLPVEGACGRAASSRAASPIIWSRARGAYREIWLDGEKIAGGEPEEVEPIYGKTYLPRKFKTVVAVPPSNDVDIFAHDLGFIAILDDAGDIAGWNVTVGGGMGMTHGEPDTYPRTADVMGFCETRGRDRGRRGRGHGAARLGRPHQPQARAAEIHHRGPRARCVPRRGGEARGRDARRAEAVHLHVDRRPLRLDRRRERQGASDALSCRTAASRTSPAAPRCSPACARSPRCTRATCGSPRTRT